MKRYAIAMILIVVISLGALATNITVRRGPVHDQHLSDDLSQLQSLVETYYSDRLALPVSLVNLNVTDAELAARLTQYGYNRLSTSHYELCATFETRQVGRNNGPSYGGYVDLAVHPKGYHCFELTVSPNMSPIK